MTSPNVIPPSEMQIHPLKIYIDLARLLLVGWIFFFVIGREFFASLESFCWSRIFLCLSRILFFCLQGHKSLKYMLQNLLESFFSDIKLSNQLLQFQIQFLNLFKYEWDLIKNARTTIYRKKKKQHYNAKHMILKFHNDNPAIPTHYLWETLGLILQGNSFRCGPKRWNSPWEQKR